MAGKKFVNLHESYMRRYQRGGFLVGDVFKFNDNFKSTDEFKELGFTQVPQIFEHVGGYTELKDKLNIWKMQLKLNNY